MGASFWCGRLCLRNNACKIVCHVCSYVQTSKTDLEIPVYDYFTIRPQWKEIRRILNIGIPSGIENSMFQFGKLAIQSTVSLMGMAAIAAQGMAI
mgnify:FL=1